MSVQPDPEALALYTEKARQEAFVLQEAERIQYEDYMKAYAAAYQLQTAKGAPRRGLAAIPPGATDGAAPNKRPG